MNGFMIRYYFLKKIINKLPEVIKKELEYTDDTLFDLATFLSTPYFYKLLSKFRKDKYKIYQRFDIDNLEKLLLESIILLSKVHDYKKLLLVYSMEAYISFDKYIIPYINTFKDEKTSLTEALLDLDYYYTLKYDNIDLSKTRISDIFKTKFIYQKYMDDLIHKPFVKVYSFFLSEEYMKKSYKNKNKFLRHHTKKKKGIKLLLTKLNDKLFYNKLPITLHELSYNDFVDTKILNLEKNTYSFDGKDIKLDFDEFIEKIINITYERIYAINEYLFYKKSDKLLKLYNTDIKL